MVKLNINKKPEDARVVVAMSGGVDSTTVAALMHEAGYETIGITLQLYDHGKATSKAKACCAGQDIYDAKRACEQIGIPHYVLNYESLFRESVIEEFADSYIRGETPIPCVRCNQTVKFRDLLRVAHDLGADALVTGHYVQRIDNGNGIELHRGKNHNKDQSYFLFTTTKEQLDFVHFPLGNMSKNETREHAKRFGLEVADKAESQDICFVPDGNYAKIVEKLRPESCTEGDVVHIDGRVMGQHKGIINFTVGQGKGLGLGYHKKLFVIKLDPHTNQVIVGPREALANSEFMIKELNWLCSDEIPADGLEVQVKLRSMQEPVIATIYPTKPSFSNLSSSCLTRGSIKILEMDSPRYSSGTAGSRVKPKNDTKWLIELHTPQEAVTPGQACVIYDNERVLGGGWITADHKQALKIAA